jgi:hypothetical protein
MATHLGIFPQWQYSNDPSVNPKINPHVQYPTGIYQTTIQPVGPWAAPSSLKGLGQWGHPYHSALGQFPRPKGFHLLGLRGLGTIGDTVSSIGTLIVLALAGYGGWSIYKRFTK